ncbi:hypothetical protein OJF2_19880 [Aquisphaera giovannonii]|uniref:Heparan-alpha-glucosaminide N-acetyltransferase catalytic domain-containing protein n=1 Tax=Aquisphaera giovannonii TaxID=406548 RepID=A0A5B9VYP9_9BACT|nr:hypothetical protein [Aquisphaera giovannonii]QEH33486.1 hypothetical protein OJF2_19880 [Aquisphaera giovannonii]
MSTHGPVDSPTRIASLDQFRGYTVVGMLLVNFVGGFQAVGAIWKHHNTYCSYADTIMPQFFFAVGFAYRLTFLRRVASLGVEPAVRAVVVRCLGLILIGLVLYHLDGKAASWADLRRIGPWGVLAGAFRREPFQTLVHIALTSLWILPVIGAGPAWRLAFLASSAGLHLALSRLFYFEHAWSVPVIDGGPLGFLSWAIPTLAGSFAYDVVKGADGSRLRPLGRLVGWAVSLMLAGYGLSCLGAWLPPPPFVQPPRGTPVDMWTMSQRTGSVSYLTFSAGVAMMVYAAFVLACDVGGHRIGVFRTFGKNALAAYILHGMVADAVKPYVPNDSPLWYALAGFLIYFGICYLLIRALERQGVYLRL